ncbi:MAG TPA: prolipoprotein diacylglyceryl transferase family protein [Streptosporangiaceae bacterium]|nr:prolipoprotein diacylglyceryl transferase family protein [Streptosporangiaceae bacterium]
MPLAYVPGPVSGQWHLGPIAVHGYAVCVVLGVLAVLWIAESRYRAMGGRPWLIVDAATVAIPAGLLGARLFRLIVDYQWYFGPHHDWVSIFRIWDGGFGLPGGVTAGVAAIWVWCRRHAVGFGPVFVAAVPGLAFGQAISLLGNWFSQDLYGPPTTMPWAVPVSPWNRAPGYQDFGTFQPLFLYEAIWDVLVGVALVYLIRWFSLTGDRALGLSAGLYVIGRLGAASFVLLGPQQRSGVVVEQVLGFAVLVCAVAYLYLTRTKRGPEPLVITGPQRPGHLRHVSVTIAQDARPTVPTTPNQP